MSNQLEDVAPEDKEEEKECKCPNTHSDEIMFASKLCSLQNEVADLQSNLAEKQKEYNKLEVIIFNPFFKLYLKHKLLNFL